MISQASYLYKVEIPILYHDDNLIVVSKPNNMLVHHSYYARNIKTQSLVEFFKGKFKLYPVHRLDHKTSGLIILAKSSEIAAKIQQQFEKKTIEKKYLALVRGFTPKEGKIDTPVKNADTGKYKESLTLFRTLQSIEVPIAVEPYSQSRYSLIEFIPKTGRMHQLRKHANKMSHPIIGDHKYGNRHHNRMFAEQLNLPNLFLHAYSLSFDHPITLEKIELKALLPGFWNTMQYQLDWTIKFP